MDEKKEVQATIVEDRSNGKKGKEEFLNVLKLVSPGTHLRTGMENIVKAGKGAIIVVGNDMVNPIIDGGFKINAKFSPQKLLELAKMDGAIILSKDMRKILYANVHLAPDSKIHSNETGTRHKAAERTAKMTGTLAIAISERKNEITLFHKKVRYALKGTDEILRKANEQIQILEKQRELFDKNIERLNRSELRNYPNLNHAIAVIQKGKIIEKISSDLKKYLIELGNEGTILKSRLKELLFNVERETNLIIKDYTKVDVKKSRILLDALSYDEIIDSENILKSLAYEEHMIPNSIKGWRILSKTSLTEAEIAALIKELTSLGKTLNSSVSAYRSVLGDDRANFLKEEIEKIKLNF
jgi:diadenylate cyclase